MKSYEDLEVWKKAIDLSVNIYEMTKLFPMEERYGLTSQIKRSAVSIASNIAEGSGRSTERDFIRFIAIARGSASELKTQIIIAYRIGFLNEIDYEKSVRWIDEITRMLSGLRKSLEARNPQLVTSN